MESWFLPLDVPMPVKAEHLHAAISRWFDVATPDSPDHHHDVTKPYTISPPTQHRGRWGVEVSTITPEASWRLRTVVASGLLIRLGTRAVPVARPVLIARTSWNELASLPVRDRWVVDFLSPTTFRTGQRASPFPTPPVMLRGPMVCWDTFSGLSPRVSDARRLRELWVSDVELQTVHLSLRGLSWPAVLGRVEVRSDDPALSRAVTPLFGVAPFCGMGSFRGKGLGVVRVSDAA